MSPLSKPLMRLGSTSSELQRHDAFRSLPKSDDVPRMSRRPAAVLVALGLVLAACSGSADPEPPALSPTSSDSISEAEAVDAAEAVAAGQDLSTQNLEIQPSLLFGEWQVSFEPADSDSLSGGFLVVLDAKTGDLIDVIPYQ